jgi:hypothetical protein
MAITKLIPNVGPPLPAGRSASPIRWGLRPAGAGRQDDRPLAGRWRPGGVGGWRRGLRRQPRAARRALQAAASATCWRSPATTMCLRRTSHRAEALLRRVRARAWQCVSAGKGAKGHRHDDWAFLRLDHDGPAPGGQARQHWLMTRRNQRTGAAAYYRCYTPRPVPLAVLVRVAGRRWTIEERFQTGKAWSAWTSTRFAAGGRGTGGSRWRCSPTPSWWWP